jgi:GGDEF domain-containing protein
VSILFIEEVRVSASIGIAVRQPDTLGPAELVAQGDFAMYTASLLRWSMVGECVRP